jgi:hypothetical protein
MTNEENVLSWRRYRKPPNVLVERPIPGLRRNVEETRTLLKHQIITGTAPGIALVVVKDEENATIVTAVAPALRAQEPVILRLCPPHVINPLVARLKSKLKSAAEVLKWKIFF